MGRPTAAERALGLLSVRCEATRHDYYGAPAFICRECGGDAAEILSSEIHAAEREAVRAALRRVEESDWFLVLGNAMKFKGSGQSRSTIEKASVEELRFIAGQVAMHIRAALRGGDAAMEAEDE